MRGHEQFKLDKEILDILGIPDLLFTNQTLSKKLSSKWKSGNILIKDDLKKILHYSDNTKIVPLNDIIRRIKINHIYILNKPPNCIFYSYDQKPLY
jgi:hypothetical protein